MLKIRHVIFVLGMLLYSAASPAQISIGIGLPNLSIGINLREYPEFVIVPGYPVYYAPQEDANLFFYDGMYWVYQDDEWYASSWYNGPWALVDRDVVPLFVLRIPVSYYRQPPAFFIGWRSDAPPRWGDHWGRDWEQRRNGWDRWNRRAVPAAAPLPVYQRRYSGERYPRQVEQQHEFQQQHYRYQPRDPVVRQHFQERTEQNVPVRQENRVMPGERGSLRQNIQRPMLPQANPATSPLPSQQRGDEALQRPLPAYLRQERPEVQDQRRPPQPVLNKREQPRPGPQEGDERRQGRDATPEEQERGPRPWTQ